MLEGRSRPRSDLSFPVDHVKSMPSAVLHETLELRIAFIQRAQHSQPVRDRQHGSRTDAKKCKSQDVKKYCFTSYTRGIMAKGICGRPELEQGHSVSGRLLVSLALGVAARGRGLSADVHSVERPAFGPAGKSVGDSLLLLLGLVAEGVDACTGTLAERVVRVLGLLLCGR